MMGRLEGGRERVYYNFRLEDQVPANHLLRKIYTVLDFDGIRVKFEPFCSEIGRGVLKREVQHSGQMRFRHLFRAGPIGPARAS